MHRLHPIYIYCCHGCEHTTALLGAETNDDTIRRTSGLVERVFYLEYWCRDCYENWNLVFSTCRNGPECFAWCSCFQLSDFVCLRLWFSLGDVTMPGTWLL